MGGPVGEAHPAQRLCRPLTPVGEGLAGMLDALPDERATFARAALGRNGGVRQTRPACHRGRR